MDPILLSRARKLALDQLQTMLGKVSGYKDRLTELTNDHDVQKLDLLVDGLIRLWEGLPDRPEGADPYVGLFPSLQIQEGPKVDPNLVIRALSVVPQAFKKDATEAIPLIFECCNFYKVTHLPEIAYVLATAEWESRFKPQTEKRASESRQPKLYAQQQRYWPSGFFGRGFVQLTWEHNYEKMGKLLDLPLKTNPDLALKPIHAAQILVLGMRDGHFTGRKLADCFKLSVYDFVQARKIVNGTDRAVDIADIATRYWAALKKGL